MFYAFSISRGDTTAEALATLLSEIKRFQDEGVTEDELSLQKDTILNRAVFRLTSLSGAERTARAELLGLAANYYDTHLEDIQARLMLSSSGAKHCPTKSCTLMR
ncbi:MAG: hypothetical protein R2865_02370 [Deinococcales bacterium]